MTDLLSGLPATVEGYDIAAEKLPPANHVFLVDVKEAPRDYRFRLAGTQRGSEWLASSESAPRTSPDCWSAHDSPSSGICTAYS
mgnify:CR=1 FL=1